MLTFITESQVVHSQLGLNSLECDWFLRLCCYNCNLLGILGFAMGASLPQSFVHNFNGGIGNFFLHDTNGRALQANIKTKAEMTTQEELTSDHWLKA